MRKQRVIPIAKATGKAAPAPEDGWRALSTLSEPRLSEMAENYRVLGYEVQVRDVQRTGEAGCTTCFDAGAPAGQTYGTLYVRPLPGQGGGGEPFE